VSARAVVPKVGTSQTTLRAETPRTQSTRCYANGFALEALQVRMNALRFGARMSDSTYRSRNPGPHARKLNSDLLASASVLFHRAR
jgi:hypothetical protein